ncbi:hypothetical protein K504DRAFT_408249, partial [Pleomassaria siparia CBS 279.74]
MPMQHRSHRPSGPSQHNASSAQTSLPESYQRTYTEPSLLRLPSTSSTASVPPVLTRSRRATNPSTPTTTLPPSQVSTSTSTSPSYFSSQHHPTSGKEVRSPASRRPPASFSGNGTDTSRGPPITLITRGTVDKARRPSQSASDYAYTHQHLLSSALQSPSGIPRDSSEDHMRRKGFVQDSRGYYTPPQPQKQTSTLSRQNSTRSTRHPPQQHMASSVDDSSDYDSGRRSQSEDAHFINGRRRRGATDTSGTDGEQGEDLFLHIAQDNVAKDRLRLTTCKSRIARASNRQSLPSTLHSPSQALPSPVLTPNANGRRMPSSIETAPGTPRRNSLLPTSRTQREQSPMTPTYPLEIPRSRLTDLSPNPALPPSSPRVRDQDLSPKQFLSQIGRRRPSHPDTLQTPPSRAQTYRPSNLNYSSSRDNQETSQAAQSQGTPSQPQGTPSQPQGTPSRAEGTESLDDSTGPAASVWDELDDLKTRIRKIELGGKIPTTSGAVVANATADRPRTANTSVTTVSSSPKQQRKPTTSPDDPTVEANTVNKAHPVLREALARTKQYVSPSVFRVLEATASEAIGLAEMTGGGAPQGTLHLTSTMLNGAPVPDRQVRRKADNICRSLTELCIELCNTKSTIASPALRTVASTPRRPSVQINGESPPIRQSIEPESDEIPRSSPSRAMDRIQARRTSMLAAGINGSPRESSQEPPTPSQSGIPTRLSRASTSLTRTRRKVDDDDDDDDDSTFRAPSRAVTDFRDIRFANSTSRFSREFTFREPMPQLQPSPALQPQTPSLRRPTITGTGNDNNLFSRTNGERYTLDRRSASTYEKQLTPDIGPRMQYNMNRNSTGGAGISRTASLGKRLRVTT